MRRKYFAPLSFLLAIILFFNVFMPVQAAVDTKLLWDRSFDGVFIEDFAVNDQNEATLASYFPYETEYAGWNVYAFDLMKVNEKGDVVKKVHKKATDLAIYTIDNINYTALANSKTGMVELYDDNFQLVANKSLPIKEGPIFVDMVDEVLFISNLDMSTFDSETFALNPIDLEPVLSYDSYNLRYEITVDWLTDELIIEEYKLGSKKEQLVVDTKGIQTPGVSSLRLDYLAGVFKEDGYYYVSAAYYNPSSYNAELVGLLKINESGQIVDQTYYTVEGSEGYFSNYRFNDKIIITDRNTIRLEYEMPTLQLTEEKTLTEGNAEFGVLTDHLYFIEENYQITVKNQYDEVLYKLPTAYAYSAINDHYIWVFGSKSEDVYSVLYDIKTGERVGIDYLDKTIVLNEYLLTLERHWGWEGDNSTHARLYKNSGIEKPEQPEGPSYESDKQWKITFNKDVDQASVMEDSIYVVDEKGVKVEGLTYTVEGNKVFVSAPQNGYEPGKHYTLHITEKIFSTESKQLRTAKTKKFFVE